jgi:acetyltransferase
MIEEQAMSADARSACDYDAFLKPRGVVVIGVSNDASKLGYGLARNLVESGYQGAIHFVNTRSTNLLQPDLFGLPVYQTIEAIPDPVDLAVILIPAPFVPGALEACGRRGIRGAIIASGGFREVGEMGAALEAECLAIAKRHGMRLVGPNCIGILDTHLPLNVTFLAPPGPCKGDVAFISQSGAICAAVIDWAGSQGLGFSLLVSLGNEADLSETDFLSPVADDPYTRVITLYLESIRDGRRFIEAAQRVGRSTPIVALKVGRFMAGQRAAASHTGALAGADHAYSAAFSRAGILRAETTEEMFDWARALAWCPPLPGRRIAVLTNAGGPGVTAADALEVNGLLLADLQQKTANALHEMLPAAASTVNPVDMLSSADERTYANCLELLLADEAVDGVMVIAPPPPMTTAVAIAKAIIPVVQGTSKPVVIALMGDVQISAAAELLRQANIPEYRFPERAASALGALAKRVRFLEKMDQPTSVTSDFPSDRAKQAAELLREVVAQHENHSEAKCSAIWLPQETLQSLLSLYGIPTPALRLVHSATEAALAAKEMGAGKPDGMSVALKVVSPDLSHKSDVGGVRLGVSTPAGAAEAYAHILDAVGAARPDAQIQGVQVQQMVEQGQEVILGAVQDLTFGPLIMFGSGGIEVEGLRDIAFALAPLTKADIEGLISETWAGRKLAGFRSLPPADQPAVADCLRRLSQLATDLPELTEIEINPLRVLKNGDGCVALDARARVDIRK